VALRAVETRPHCFIKPDEPGGQALGLIGDLAAGTRDKDALVISEGGNFTLGGRQRAIVPLRRRGQRRQASRAAGLGPVLLPPPSGALSAIDAAPHAGLIIVARTGLDHLDSAAAVWRGIPPSTGRGGSPGGGSLPERCPPAGMPARNGSTPSGRESMTGWPAMRRAAARRMSGNGAGPA
jgi:hypothetical protein